MVPKVICFAIEIPKDFRMEVNCDAYFTHKLL